MKALLLLVCVIWSSFFRLLLSLSPDIYRPRHDEIHRVRGQRCLLIQEGAACGSGNDKNNKNPPLLLLGGIAQTISSWEHHLPALSRNRQVFVYECLGQGPSLDDYDYSNVTLPYQAEQLALVIRDVFPNKIIRNNSNIKERGVDIVGFSFGARVAMALTCSHPNLVRKLHLTGIGTDRSEFGHLSIASWKDSLRYDTSLRSFAWATLLSTYSSAFLYSQYNTITQQTSNNKKDRRRRIDRWIDHICNSNHAPGLLALLEQAEIKDPNDPWHVASMAERIARQHEETACSKNDSDNNNNNFLNGQICVGDMDQMAPPFHAKDLCRTLKWSNPTIIKGFGHAIPMECPREWRADVIGFLEED